MNSSPVMSPTDSPTHTPVENTPKTVSFTEADKQKAAWLQKERILTASGLKEASSSIRQVLTKLNIKDFPLDELLSKWQSQINTILKDPKIPEFVKEKFREDIEKCSGKILSIEAKDVVSFRNRHTRDATVVQWIIPVPTDAAYYLQKMLDAEMQKYLSPASLGLKMAFSDPSYSEPTSKNGEVQYHRDTLRKLETGIMDLDRELKIDVYGNSIAPLRQNYDLKKYDILRSIATAFEGELAKKGLHVKDARYFHELVGRTGLGEWIHSYDRRLGETEIVDASGKPLLDANKKPVDAVETILKYFDVAETFKTTEFELKQVREANDTSFVSTVSNTVSKQFGGMNIKHEFDAISTNALEKNVQNMGWYEIFLSLRDISTIAPYMGGWLDLYTNLEDVMAGRGMDGATKNRLLSTGTGLLALMTILSGNPTSASKMRLLPTIFRFLEALPGRIQTLMRLDPLPLGTKLYTFMQNLKTIAQKCNIPALGKISELFSGGEKGGNVTETVVNTQEKTRKIIAAERKQASIEKATINANHIAEYAKTNKVSENRARAILAYQEMEETLKAEFPNMDKAKIRAAFRALIQAHTVGKPGESIGKYSPESIREKTKMLHEAIPKAFPGVSKELSSKMVRILEEWGFAGTVEKIERKSLKDIKDADGLLSWTRQAIPSEILLDINHWYIDKYSWDNNIAMALAILAWWKEENGLMSFSDRLRAAKKALKDNLATPKEIEEFSNLTKRMELFMNLKDTIQRTINNNPGNSIAIISGIEEAARLCWVIRMRPRSDIRQLSKLSKDPAKIAEVLLADTSVSKLLEESARVTDAKDREIILRKAQEIKLLLEKAYNWLKQAENGVVKPEDSIKVLDDRLQHMMHFLDTLEMK